MVLYRVLEDGDLSLFRLEAFFESRELFLVEEFVFDGGFGFGWCLFVAGLGVLGVGSQASEVDEAVEGDLVAFEVGVVGQGASGQGLELDCRVQQAAGGVSTLGRLLLGLVEWPGHGLFCSSL